MDRLGLIDETLRAFDSALPTVTSSRCVATRYRASECRRCLDVCPADAISLAPVHVDADVCIACGACAAVCRTGALDYPQPRSLLHSRLAGAAGGQAVVACSQAAPDEAGVAPDAVVACLAGLSAVDLVGAAAGGVERLILVSGDCASCPAGRTMAGHDLGDGPTATWLGTVGATLRLERLTTVSSGAPMRPPAVAVSRRGLFGLLAGKGRVVAAAALAPSAPRIEDLHAVTPPPAFHRRMLSDLAVLERRTGASCVLPADLPFVVVEIGPECDACGLCARYCPHGALVAGDGVVMLEAGLCTGCGLCAETCPRSAIVLRRGVLAEASEAGSSLGVLRRRDLRAGAGASGVRPV